MDIYGDRNSVRGQEVNTGQILKGRRGKFTWNWMLGGDVQTKVHEKRSVGLKWTTMVDIFMNKMLL